MTAAGIILAGGLGEIGTVLPWALAVALLVLAAVCAAGAGVSAVLLFKGIARWRQIRGEAADLPDLPRGGPELSDDVTEVIRGWAAEWEKQKGEGRG